MDSEWDMHEDLWERTKGKKAEKAEKDKTDDKKDKKAQKAEKAQKDKTAQKAEKAGAKSKATKRASAEADPAMTTKRHAAAASVGGPSSSADVKKRPASARNPDIDSTMGVGTWDDKLPCPLKCLRVGADCAGLMPETLALHTLGVEKILVFATEQDPTKQKMIKHIHGDGIKIYNTVAERNADSKAGGVDLLTGGFPCQPFSAAGLHMGTADKRGIVFFEIRDYIAAHKPRCVVLENVKGLVYNHWAEFKDP